MASVRPPVDVMLARAVPTLPAASALPGGVQYEQKWDGYRLVAFSAPRPYGAAWVAARFASGPASSGTSWYEALLDSASL